MLIALDYDKTFTLDTSFWRRFCCDAEAAGHKVICVTGRREPPSSIEPRLPDSVQVICAGQMFKRHAAAKEGFAPDVWIDDMPGTIEPQRYPSWPDDENTPPAAPNDSHGEVANG